MYYPQFDPVAFSIGPLQVHWYGLMYLIAFAIAWGLAQHRRERLQLYKTQVNDLIFYAAVGVVIGGRVGYMLFYDFPEVIQHPLSLFKVWEGGMSFHGGLLGVLVALWYSSKKFNQSIWNITDFVAPLVPLGIACGRLGNFINGELWGRETNIPWGMVFPDGGPVLRHPSELYELLLEGVLLFVILWLYSKKPRQKFAVSAVFLLGYGCFRFFCEFFRMPDAQYGYLLWHWVTMGQLLSLPMIIVGVVALSVIYTRRARRIHSKGSNHVN